MTKKYQVVIVGGGPTGVALSLSLASRGVTSAVVERRAGMHNIPKGQNLTHRTLENFYFWGCVDELRAARIMPPGHGIGEVGQQCGCLIVCFRNWRCAGYAAISINTSG
jgi:4-hydroxyisophthalate hydroxylase